MHQHCDVAIIGAGPGGSAAAVFLIQKGYRPLILERAEFPRFHIGESLVQASQPILDRLGLADELQHSGYEFKFGGRTYIAPDPHSERLRAMTFLITTVPHSCMPLRTFAYQVERAKFDQQLLDHAIRQGAEVRRASVIEVCFEDKRATGVKVRNSDGTVQFIGADFVLDASGRRALVARQLGLLENDPVIQTSACFGHFHNVSREAGQGYFEAYFVDNGWVWFIPFVGNRMSVGFVQNRPQSDAWSNDGEEVLLSVINRHRWLQKRFVNAVQLGKVRMLRNLAYRSRQITGDGWLAIGDASFFIDPVFSTGVHIALTTAEEGVKAIDAFLKGGRDQKVLDRYERRFRKYRDFTFGFVRAVYRVLRTRLATSMLVWWCGSLRRDFQSFMLRRFLFWINGNYESYRATVWWTRLSMNFLAVVLAPALCRLTGKGTWKDFERNPFTGPPLAIPKCDQGFQETVVETEPPDPAADLNPWAGGHAEQQAV